MTVSDGAARQRTVTALAAHQPPSQAAATVPVSASSTLTDLALARRPSGGNSARPRRRARRHETRTRTQAEPAPEALRYAAPRLRFRSSLADLAVDRRPGLPGFQDGTAAAAA
jgi:hypothetical protein